MPVPPDSDRNPCTGPVFIMSQYTVPPRFVADQYKPPHTPHLIPSTSHPRGVSPTYHRFFRCFPPIRQSSSQWWSPPPSSCQFGSHHPHLQTKYQEDLNHCIKRGAWRPYVHPLSAQDPGQMLPFLSVVFKFSTTTVQSSYSEYSLYFLTNIKKKNPSRYMKKKNESFDSQTLLPIKIQQILCKYVNI